MADSHYKPREMSRATSKSVTGRLRAARKALKLAKPGGTMRDPEFRSFARWHPGVVNRAFFAARARDERAMETRLFPPHTSRPGAFTTEIPSYRYSPVATAEEAIRRIAEEADVLEVAGRRWLLIQAPEPLFDFLACFGADREDVEVDALEDDDSAEDGGERQAAEMRP